MANVSVTAANVATSASSQVGSGVAGASITAGQSIYLDTSTTTWKLAQANGTAAVAGSGGLAIALNGAASGQPITFLTGGAYNPGGTAVAGGVYVVSAANAGAIAPIADLSSGNYVSILGYADTTSSITVLKVATGVTK